MILDFLKNDKDVEKEEVVESILDEETAAERFAKDTEPENSSGNSITDILDDCAKKANSFYRILAAKAKRGIIPATAKETNKFNPLFVGPTGAGKAQPLTSKVYTPEGYKLMADIQKDDIILDGNGNVTRVLEVFPQEKKHDIYRISFDDNTSIEVADNHLNSLCACNRNKNSTKINLILNTIELYNYVNNPKYRSWAYPRLYVEPVTINAWKSGDLPVDPYLLGCLLGDGCLGKGGKISFTSADNELVAAVDSILYRDWNLKLSLHSNYDYNICNIDSEKSRTRKEKAVFKEALNNLGVCVKSEHKFIPDIYKYASYEDRLALVRGLMDTDGTVSGQKLSRWTQKYIGGKCSFCTSSEQLAEDLAFILRSLGCRVTITTQCNKKYHYKHKDVDEVRECHNAYHLYIAQPAGLSLFNLSRKDKLQLKARFEPRRNIIAVELIRQDNCKCLYVESDCHTYITDNLTITHNTSIISTWARDRGYELITLNMMGDALDFLGVKTINRDYDLKVDDEGNTKKVARVSTIATQAFDPFLTGKTKILFLDELNKTNPRILQALYDLISFHTVQNGDEVMYLPKLLFTVGAMNPSEYGGGRDQLDPALKARMQIVYVNYDTKGLKEYMLKELNQDLEVIEAEIKDIKDNGGSEEDAKDWLDDYKIALGKKDLLETIFANPKSFTWTNPQSIADADELAPVLVPRTFEMALSNCDGTKADFLKKVLKLCGADAAEMINNILAKYKDKEHKANLIWGKDYSVKDDEAKKETSAEDEITGTKEEEEEAELSTNLLKRLQKIRQGL